MSYCVNCGVELHESQKKCPLCDTVVINPNITSDKNTEAPFPSEQQLVSGMEARRWIAGVIAIILAIPMSVCLVCNYGIQHTFSWSLIVTGAIIVVMAATIPPLLFDKVSALLFALLDTAAVLLFLYLLKLEVPGTQEKDWYWGIAFPIVICVAVFICINGVMIKHKIGKLYIAAVLFMTVGALVVAIEIITDLFIDNCVELSWSLFALVPCALLALLYVFIQKKQRVKESLQKRFRL